MALDYENLKKLAVTVSKANASNPTSYSFNGENVSYEALDTTLRNELNELAGTYALYRENKNTIFRLIEETIDQVFPEKVRQQYGMFAEVKTLNQGEKAIFAQRVTLASKRRAKQFVTKVGLAGRYEVFKLDGKKIEIPTGAYGGAAQVGFEEFLDGRVQWADLMDVIMVAFDEIIYKEIERALKACIVDLPQANRSVQTSFDEAEMDRLLAVTDSYGWTSIYCTYEFASKMLPNKDWASSALKDERWANGYLANYKGHKVIVLRQSYTNELNEEKVMDPTYAWLIPSGGHDKPVKIVFEGATAVREVESQEDWSRDFQTYKKVGVGTIITNNIGVYRNTSLT